MIFAEKKKKGKTKRERFPPRRVGVKTFHQAKNEPKGDHVWEVGGGKGKKKKRKFLRFSRGKMFVLWFTLQRTTKVSAPREKKKKGDLTGLRQYLNKIGIKKQKKKKSYRCEFRQREDTIQILFNKKKRKKRENEVGRWVGPRWEAFFQVLPFWRVFGKKTLPVLVPNPPGRGGGKRKKGKRKGFQIFFWVGKGTTTTMRRKIREKRKGPMEKNGCR